MRELIGRQQNLSHQLDFGDNQIDTWARNLSNYQFNELTYDSI